jgi:Predicted Zn-dependent peptidases
MYFVCFDNYYGNYIRYICPIDTKKIVEKNIFLPLDSNVRTGKLANGFTYYLRNNKTPKNRIIFYLVNKVGSILETEDQRGLAHFIEHMSFNGTKHFPKNELVNYLQKSGVRFGADINAYTGFDETVYQLPLPTDPEIIKNGIEIMHDWAQSASLDPFEINKERGVVLEEKRLGKGVNDRMRNIYFPFILNNSRYADRLPIGNEEVLKNFKPEAIKSYYQDWYRPNLQALIIVGDMDLDKMEQIIKVKFSGLKNPAKEKQRTKYTVPLTGKNQFLTVTDPEMTETNLEVITKQIGQPLHTIAQYRDGIIHQLFNSMLNVRYTELRHQPHAPYLNGSAGISPLLGGLNSYNISVSVKPGELEKGFKAVWRENEKIKRFGFTTTELDRAKTSYFNQFESMLKEKDKTPSNDYVNEYVQHFLHGTATPGISYEFKLVKELLKDITLDDLNKFSKTINKTTDRDILILAPEKDKAGLPTEAVVDSWIKAVEVENIVAYKDETTMPKFLKKEPVAGKIVSSTKDAKLGITTVTLSNGIKVIIKPTDFKNNEILFNGFSFGGTSLYSDSDYQSATAANIIPSYGAGNYNSTELNKYLANKQIDVQISVGERTQNISGTTVNRDLETALQLMYAFVTEPRKDSLMFQSMIARSKAALANRTLDPNSVFQDTMSAVLGSYNFRRTGPSIEKINQIDLDKTFAIYKERFENMRGFTFVFTGSIDTMRFLPLIEKYIGGLPASENEEQARDLNINIPVGNFEKVVYKGAEPKATVNLIFSGAFNYNFVNRLQMDALKEVLQIRLIERLREDESGVYSPNVSITTSKLPQSRFSLMISFGCAPENVNWLTSSVLDEIEKLKISGPNSINLNKFKAESQRDLELALETNSFWLSYLTEQLQIQENLNQVYDYVQQLDRITSANIKDLADKYMTNKNYIRFILLPTEISGKTIKRK